METSQQHAEVNIDHSQPANSDENVLEAVKVFGKAHDRAEEFWTALWKWSRQKGQYHSLEMYAYAKTLANDPDELYLIGVMASLVVHKTAVD
jgi:hypothetical protein